MRTAIGHGLVGPERQENSVVKRAIENGHAKLKKQAKAKAKGSQTARKGTGTRFPGAGADKSGTPIAVGPNAVTQPSQETLAGEPGRDLLSS